MWVIVLFVSFPDGYWVHGAIWYLHQGNQLHQSKNFPPPTYPLKLSWFHWLED